MKKIIAYILALVMVLGVGGGVLAADPQTAADIMSAVDFTDTDTVSITLSNDIGGDLDLYVPAGKTLHIRGDYKLGYVYIFGEGTVTLQVKAIEAGLAMEGDMTVTVVTDYISGGSDTAQYDEAEDSWMGESRDAVAIFGNATVSITGDLIGGHGVMPEEGKKDEDSYADAGEGLYVVGDTTKVTVVGDITGGNGAGVYAYGGDGIEVVQMGSDAGVPQITVTGNVKGGDVDADPTVDGEESLGGTGIIAWEGEAKITVNGNVTGGNTTGYNGTGGFGISVGYSSVTVNGDVTGGNVTGTGDVTAGSGIYVYPLLKEEFDEEDIVPPADIYVDGTVAGGQGPMGAAVYYDAEEIAYANMDDARLDYEELRENGSSDTDIMVDMMSMLVMHNNEGLIGSEEIADFYTTQYRVMAAELEYPLPDDYTIEFDGVDIVPDDHMIEIDQLFLHADETTQAEILAKVVQALVDWYNETAWEIISDTARWLSAPKITAWYLQPEESGLPYVTSLEVDPSVMEMVVYDMVQYIVRVADAEGGTVVTDKAIVKEDETVTIKATGDAGYVLDGLYVYNGKLESNLFKARLCGGILVEGRFVTTVNSDTTDNPPTGDGTVWFAVLAVTALAGAAVLILRRQKA